jgi:hypothetical protein
MNMVGATSVPREARQHIPAIRLPLLYAVAQIEPNAYDAW